jgi:hypothetical protein
MKHEFGLYRRTDLESNNSSISSTTNSATDTTGKNITTTATLIPWNQLIVLAQQEGLEALVRQQQSQQQDNQTKTRNNKKSNSNKAASRNADLMAATHELSAIQYTILSQLLHHHHTSTTMQKVGNIKPWVYINATVVERINFGTGSSVRVLHVAVPEDKNSGYVKK